MIVRRPASCWRTTPTPTWKQRHGYVMTLTAITLVVITMPAFYSPQVRAMHDQHHVGWVRQPQTQTQTQQRVPIFHVGQIDLRLHIDDNRAVVQLGSIESQSRGGWYGHDSSRATGSSVLTSFSNRTVDITIPHGGDTSTEADVCVNKHTREYRYTREVHTDLSNVARKIVQDFKTELLVLAQRNCNEMRMLFSNVTFEIQKARHQQRQSITNVAEEQHQQSQSGSIVDMEDESPLASSNLALRNIEHVVDDEAFVDASSVPQENSEFHELVADVAGTTGSDIDIDASAPSNVANSVNDATISKVTMNEEILHDTDNFLDLDKYESSEIDVANSQETPSVIKNKRKRKKAKKARNLPVADMKVSAKLDDTSTPDDECDDIDRKFDLIPTATEVVFRSILRLVLSTLTAAIVCLLYIAMKRFLSIILGWIIGSGIQTGVSTAETKSTIIPKP